jgi:hypothetical protein
MLDTSLPAISCRAFVSFDELGSLYPKVTTVAESIGVANVSTALDPTMLIELTDTGLPSTRIVKAVEAAEVALKVSLRARVMLCPFDATVAETTVGATASIMILLLFDSEPVAPVVASVNSAVLPALSRIDPPLRVSADVEEYSSLAD